MERPGYRYALSALRERRSSLAGEIAALRKRVIVCEREMGHIDASLRILAPCADPTLLRPTRFQPRIKLFRPGDLGRLIMGVLRRAGRPMGTHEIAGAIEKALGAAPGSLAKRVRINFSYQVKCGRMVKIGRGRSAKWAAAERHEKQKPTE